LSDSQAQSQQPPQPQLANIDLDPHRGGNPAYEAEKIAEMRALDEFPDPLSLFRAAAVIGVSYPTLLRMRDKGEIRTTKRGNRAFIPKAEIVRLRLTARSLIAAEAAPTPMITQQTMDRFADSLGLLVRQTAALSQDLTNIAQALNTNFKALAMVLTRVDRRAAEATATAEQHSEIIHALQQSVDTLHNRFPVQIPQPQPQPAPAPPPEQAKKPYELDLDAESGVNTDEEADRIADALLVVEPPVDDAHPEQGRDDDVYVPQAPEPETNLAADDDGDAGYGIEEGGVDESLMQSLRRSATRDGDQGQDQDHII
jgi:hypothetical protein